MSRLWAIADIHGRHDLLNSLMESLVTKHGLELTTDKLIFLGDMVDRGWDSAGVVRRIRELQRAFPENVVVLAGNHEWIMINAESGGLSRMMHWYQNGGKSTEESYTDSKVLAADREWMRRLPLFHKEPGFFFSHAPISAMAEPPFTKDDLIWSYPGGYHNERMFAREHTDGVVGVCGHIHALNAGIMRPRFYEHYIYADAGCGCSEKAPLVAIEVRTRKLVHAWPAQAMGTPIQEANP